MAEYCLHTLVRNKKEEVEKMRHSLKRWNCKLSIWRSVCYIQQIDIGRYTLWNFIDGYEQLVRAIVVPFSDRVL